MYLHWLQKRNSQNWDARFQSFYELKFKVLYFEASADDMAKIKSQALHITQNQKLKCWGGWQPSLLHLPSGR